MGDRLLLAARKSRKGDGEEDSRYARQETRAAERVEADGHVIVATVRDTVSSQSLPWERKNLRKWLADPAKLALWDALYVTETDRLARMDDEGFHRIESWCYDNGKQIMTAEGVQFPPRDDSDRYQWLGLKRRARTYWEDTRDKHLGGREIARANGGIIGKPPFGYAMAGEKYHKTFVPHPENGPLLAELFTRIAAGESGATVAAWLGEATGRTWRVKSVLDMVRNRTYLGERDGVSFQPLVSEKLWTDASATVAARSFVRSAPAAIHMYSGCLYCARCGVPLYRHRDKYRCGLGRRGVRETRCGMPGLSYTAVNDAVEAVMSGLRIPEQVQRAEGGDAGKAAELTVIDRQMKAALAKHDMTQVAALAAAYSERDAQAAAPVRIWWQSTGRTLAEVWEAGDLAARRELLTAGLATHGFAMIVSAEDVAELAEIEEPWDVRPVTS